MIVKLTIATKKTNLSMQLQSSCSKLCSWLRRLALGWWRTPRSINALKVWISFCNKTAVACEYGNISIWNNIHRAIVRITKCWTFIIFYKKKMETWFCIHAVVHYNNALHMIVTVVCNIYICTTVNGSKSSYVCTFDS